MKTCLLVVALVAATACGSPDATEPENISVPTATSAVSSTPTTVLTTTTTVAPTTTVPSPTTVASTAVLSSPAFTVTAGAVEGPSRIEVGLGEEVVFSVVSDEVDEVHVHGFDLTFDLVAGDETLVRFVADVPGIFEVELHGSHTPLTDLVVSP